MPRIVPSMVVEFIDKVFPDSKHDSKIYMEATFIPEQKASIAAVINMLSQISISNYPITSGQYMSLLLAETYLKEILDTLKKGESIRATPVIGQKPVNPICMIRRVLASIPDEFISPKSSKLEFIKDEEWRKNLELDISPMEKALSNGEWKAATIIAGSIIEALLLWALDECEVSDVKDTVQRLKENGPFSENDKALKKAPDDWYLFHYIEVAHAMNIISERTKTEATQAKNFRNLIHPGQEIRKNHKCSRATTYSALSAVEFVIEDLRSYCDNGSE